MAMVCPQCLGEFDQRLECPRCSVRLYFQELPGETTRSRSAPNFQQSAFGRILIGLILAQGIYHGVRHLTVAGLLAADSVEPQELWGTLGGFLLLQGIQLLSLFVGGLLCGAGQRQGALLGLVLGVWNGILIVLIQPDVVDRFTSVTLYGLPLLQGAIGGISAWIGSRIWRPLTPISTGATRQVAKPSRTQNVKWFVGPVRWPRVVIGTSVAVAGTLWATVILDQVKRLSSYNLSPQSALQAQVVTWEIVGLSILVGGALAGVSTRNGLTQGLVVGVATTVILVGIRIAAPDPPSFIMLVASMFGPVVLAVMGGGFGAQLLPPVAPARPRSFDGA